MQFLYVGKKLASGNASFLFFTDQFSKPDTSVAAPFQTGVWARATTGLYLNDTLVKKLAITASAYYQFGKTPLGQDLSAMLLSGSVQYIVSKNFSAGPGIDYTTGGTTGTTSNTFDPLYGTPHKFWGSMDYFYAASPFGKGGLTDYYFKTKYNASDKFWASADIHQFSSAARVGTFNTKSFGQELDITASYNLTKQISFEGGYSHFWTTALLASPTVKNVANEKSDANWGYLMIIIKPNLFK
jgi:hypothetical protein